MNPLTKTLGFVGFSTVVAKELARDKNDRISHPGKCLLASCLQASTEYPVGNIDKSKIKQIGKLLDKIEAQGLISGAYNTTVVLSYCLISLDDAWKATKNQKARRLLDPVIKRLKWLTQTIDGKMASAEDCEIADRKYNQIMGNRYKKDYSLIECLLTEEARELWAA